MWPATVGIVKFASEIFGSLFLAQQYLLLHTSLTWSLFSQSRTPGNGVSPTKSHTREPQKTKTHTKVTRKTAAARSQKKNQLQDFYPKCLAKKKTITLRLERNNNTKKLHEKKLGEKTSICLAK
jgi:hypothetical protein